MELNTYINDGIKSLVVSLSKFYLSSVKGAKFAQAQYKEIKKSMEIRKALENSGQHVPPFLIASIASNCNLHCKGCYARAAGICKNEGVETLSEAFAVEKIQDDSDLSAEEWDKVFDQAAEIGVSFILLAGGEPLLRKDILEKVVGHRNMIFPVFTNGTLIDDNCIKLFDDNRNIFPVFSLEGDKGNTDAIRGTGVYEGVEMVMKKLHKRKILFGVSVTVNRENLREVTEDKFLQDLHAKGCGIVFYIEYVPAQEGTEDLTLSAGQSEWLLRQGKALREKYSDMSVLMFPGDEKYMGGCLAAGRGFFHINPRGGAEACPFAPYSQWNIKEHSLLEIVNSRFFEMVRELEKKGVDDHRGGCTLFNYKEEVQSLAK